MKKINEYFVCQECGYHVSPAHKTCRNHCPVCFCSLHVDGEVPWDRSSLCKQKMYPIGYKFINGDVKILFECHWCGVKRRNKRADDDIIINLQEKIDLYKELYHLGID
jgi:hypothetical protein